LDSAEIYAKRSLTLDRKSPYPYTVLASIARKKSDYAALTEYSKQVIAASGADTLYADVKERAMYELASTGSERASKATGAEKKQLARDAIAAWMPLVNSKDDVQGTVALNNLQKMYIAVGDSAQLNKIYAPIIASPASYSEGALLQAGVIASQFKRPDDAAILFEAVANRNPYSRDALNNLAASYLQAGETEKAGPVIDKLVMLDPNNPENYMLYAYQYVGKLKKKSDVKTTKLYNDSLMVWNTKSEKMPVKVSFSEFSRNSEGTTLTGSVENRSTAAKTYSLVFEFLGPKGEVLFTEPVSVGPVPAKGTKEFTIKNAKQGVAGYRYKPIT
ncbi:MAG: tetratricopeptide repeat protein, partial [Gemmatimonadales bacterium]